MTSNLDNKLNRALRKATEKTTADPTQARMDEVMNMLSSDAMDTLLDNGDLTPRAAVGSIKLLISMGCDGTLSKSKKASCTKLANAQYDSERVQTTADRHFTPFGTEQVADAISEIRSMGERIDIFERRYGDMRMAAQDFLEISRHTASGLIDKLENGVTPND